MKCKLLIAALLSTSLMTGAQTVDNQMLGYSVRYEKEHLFLQKDSGLNVVDYDIEWPEIVGFSGVPELKRIISDVVANVEVQSFDSLQMAVTQQYGTPVTKQFKTIPDDRRFCYVTVKACIVGYNANKWIAYYLQSDIEPGTLSVFKPQNISRVIVFDIARQQAFLANDLISSAVMNRLEPQDFYDNLFAPLSDDDFDDMQMCNIEGVWLDGQNINFLVKATTTSRAITYTASMPADDYSYALSRTGKRVFLKEEKRKDIIALSAPNTLDGDTIYNKVEKMPEFKDGAEGLKQYLSHVSKPAVAVTKAERVFLSFVVDKQGNIRDVNVVTPVSPDLDRHAVSVIKGMPPYTPGEQGGKKVCVRLYMPVNYRP